MRDVVGQTERNIGELKAKGDPEVDELVCSTSIVHNQSVDFLNQVICDANRWCYCRLINLIAEDAAIEDTIYHLHRALNAGRIDLERFLRVRSSLSLYPTTSLMNV